jgi:hypothetical protein
MIKKAWSKTSEDLCKLRMSSHNLEIERGRFCNKKPEERLCKKCNVVDNLEHFIFRCCRTECIREKLPLSQNQNSLTDIFENTDYILNFIQVLRERKVYF